MARAAKNVDLCYHGTAPIKPYIDSLKNFFSRTGSYYILTILTGKNYNILTILTGKNYNNSSIQQFVKIDCWLLLIIYIYCIIPLSY